MSKVFPFRQGCHWGYLNADGEIIVPAKFDAVREFKGQFGAVLTNGLWYLIDSSMNLFEAIGYNDLKGFSESFCVFKRGELRGYLDLDLNEHVVKGAYDLKGFKCSRAAISFDGDTYEYIDQELQRVFGDSYSSNSFSEKLVSFCEDVRPMQCGYKDVHGDYVIEPSFVYAGDFAEGRAFTHFGYGNNKEIGRVINIEGEVVFEIEGESDGSCFSEGKCVFWSKKRPLAGYVDRNGEVVVPAVYHNAYPFQCGLALVEESGRKFFINADGDEAFSVECDWVESFKDGLCLFSHKDRLNYVRRDGSVIWSERK